MKHKSILIALFEDKKDIEEAVKKLISGGIEKKDISVIIKGHEDSIEAIEVEKEDSDILNWTTQGAIWGGLIGALLGGAFFIIPGFGPIIGAGPISAAIAGMLGGAMSGGAILGLADALIEWGMAEAEAKKLEKLVKENKLLLMVHGDSQEMDKANEILQEFDKSKMQLHR